MTKKTEDSMKNSARAACAVTALVSALLIAPVNANASTIDGGDVIGDTWSSPVEGSSGSGENGRIARASLCTYYNVGDYPHITDGQASVHGWWTPGTCNPSQKANVEVKLQTQVGWWWEDVSTGNALVYPNGGAGKRANARYTCKNFTQERIFRTWVRAVPQSQANVAVAATSSSVKLKCG